MRKHAARQGRNEVAGGATRWAQCRARTLFGFFPHLLDIKGKRRSSACWIRRGRLGTEPIILDEGWTLKS
ncbi:MAG TPA: hypothetical protein PKN47_18720 [Nitrospira sp.]|nr:hypothetical protein [Nitrospira sp.]